jgi:hypothetical protein
MKDGILTDCAVCHGPERSPRSLYQLLPDGQLRLDVRFDETVPADRHEPFRSALFAACEEALLHRVEEGDPGIPEVRVAVGIEVGEGRTDQGAAFFAARARAKLVLHRAEVEVEGRPGVAKDRAAAVEAALGRLVHRVVLTLSW